MFTFSPEGVISSALDPDLVLGVEGEAVVVARRRENVSWSLEPVTGGHTISLASSPSLVMTDRGGRLVVERLRDECPHQSWRLVSGEVTEDPALPATSCHLRYSLPPSVSSCSDWELSCTVTVTSSSPSTYFCVVGWGPAGYSGIQQVTDTRRVAIFSMWNEGSHRVELVGQGEGVEIDDFGGKDDLQILSPSLTEECLMVGEGTGLKSMKDVDWRENERVTVRVSGVRDGPGWICSCHYILRGQEHFMASFRRTGPRPLSEEGFYSFVEDWDRCPGAQGHLTCRRALFQDQTLSIEESQFGIH